MSIRPKKVQDKKSQQIITAVIVAAAVLVALAAIYLSSGGPAADSTTIDYSKVQQGRTTDGGFIIGNPDAKVTIIAFEDFLCPHCQEYEPTIKELIQDYVLTGKAKFEFRFTPAIDPVRSVEAAHLVECSDTLQPGSFWTAHDVMFELAETARYDATTPRTFAERMGLNYAKLLDCADGAKQIATDTTLGKSMGVQGTPTIFIQIGSGKPQITPNPPSIKEYALIIG